MWIWADIMNQLVKIDLVEVQNRHHADEGWYICFTHSKQNKDSLLDLWKNEIIQRHLSNRNNKDVLLFSVLY